MQPKIRESHGVSIDGKQNFRFLCTQIHCLDAPENSPISGYQQRADGLWNPSFLALNLPPSCLTRQCRLRHDDNAPSNFFCLMLHWQFRKPWICRTFGRKWGRKKTREKVLADTRKKLGAQKALVHRLEIVFEKQRQNYEAIPWRKDPPETPRRQEPGCFKGHDLRSPDSRY